MDLSYNCPMYNFKKCPEKRKWWVKKRRVSGDNWLEIRWFREDVTQIAGAQCDARLCSAGTDTLTELMERWYNTSIMQSTPSAASPIFFINILWKGRSCNYPLLVLFSIGERDNASAVRTLTSLVVNFPNWVL